jgi:MFS superfamily sulfate permease-like transporter
MISSSSTQSGGIPLETLLTVLFVALKLTHVIAWSWWWVFAPVWVSLALVVIFISIAVGVVAACDRHSKSVNW